MAELKRNFIAGKMNKDLDERAVPDGQYRDALNIKVSTSDNSNVGTAQTLRGNTKHDTMRSPSGYYNIPDTASVVGCIAAPDRNKIYYFVSAGDANNSIGGPDIKKDYILQYDEATGRHTYVFVDIYTVREQLAANSATTDNFIYIPLLTITDVTSNNQNITGVRIGMKLTGTLGTTTYTATDNILVSDIVFDTGNSRYKVFLEKDGESFTPTTAPQQNDFVVFKSDRVLNFKKSTLINAINIVDDVIYWTDNVHEPKRIHIHRSIAGTGGTEYINNGGVAGLSAITSSESNANTFTGDTDFFHTRLVEDIGYSNNSTNANTLKVVLDKDFKIPVSVTEAHITVIRKSPTQPLDLDLFREADESRIPEGSSTPNLIHTECFNLDLFNGTEILEPDDILTNVTFEDAVDFRVGDVLLFALQSESSNAVLFNEYNMRVEVTASNVTNPNVLSNTGFELKILSIDSQLETTDKDFYVRLEENEPLFKFVFPRFSYRYKYQDGEYSTFAPFSQIAFLPDAYSYDPSDGYNLGMVNQLRKVVLKNYHHKEDTIPEDVVEIDLLYKEAGKAPVYVVKTIRPSDGHPMWPNFNINSDARGKYVLEDDLIHAILPDNQILRPYDNVPRKALAQEITASRLAYGNYVQNYTVVNEPIVNLGLSSIPVENNVQPSVKSMRTYQVGVVYSDRYGRETPVLVGKGSTITIQKEDSLHKNRLVASLDKTTEIPSWAEYYSYYVKETTEEYYNLSMDRWYNAADGNIWLSFQSSDRNKLTEEDFIVLKKRHGANEYVGDRARYKVLAIENNAPDFIKRKRKSLGILFNENQDTIGNATRGYPLIDRTFVTVQIPEFEDVFGNTDEWISTPENLQLRFYGADQRSNLYDVTKVSKLSNTYKLKIEGKFNEDVLFAAAGTSDYANRILDLTMELFSNDVENSPEFDGRFFVKINRDATLEQYILQGLGVEEYLVRATWGLRYLNNNGYRPQGSDSGEIQPTSQENLFEMPVRPCELGTGGDVYGDMALGYGDYDSIGVTNPSDEFFSLSHNRTEYDHHAPYYWGNVTNDADNPGNDETFQVKNKEIHADPLSINNRSSQLISGGTNKGRDFWVACASKQDFFIDACTAYSWNGRKENRPGNAFTGPNPPDDDDSPDSSLFQGGADGNDWEFTGDAFDKRDPGAPGFGPSDHVTGNMKPFQGQPSRGIWLGGRCMDISWTGMGTGYDGSGFDTNAPYPHRLQDVEIDNYEAAALFIEQLCSPGSKFRFQRDPDDTVYTVHRYDEETLASFGAVVEDVDGTCLAYPPHASAGNTYWKTGTTHLTGAFGIRNYSTPGDKDQYFGDNLRQRWTLVIDPPIGSGPSGYRPDRGTISGADTDVKALKHDFRQKDVIELLGIYIDDTGKPTNEPAVWETEPRTNVDLDIYWQASGLIPLRLNQRTNEELIPLGATFTLPPQTLVATGQSIPGGTFTVTSWNHKTINFTPSIPALYTLADNEIITFTKRDHYELNLRVNGAVSGGATTLKLHGDVDSDVNNIHRFPHKLDWSNCYSFGNGVESDRIRDDFNAPQIDNGVKASTVLDTQVKEERRKHGIIYSGIYNSTSGINNLNQFIAAEKITKDLNPIYGSIQSLLSRDTRLVMFCEDKVLRAESGRDILFNADGNPQVLASDKVIGAVQPYQGNYGVARNPESIAATPYRVYFTDVDKGHVLQLTAEGVSSISNVGMVDYFADIFDSGVDRCIGSYDERKREYNLNIVKKDGSNGHHQILPSSQTTITYAEGSTGWTSFKSFNYQKAVSLNNNYFSFYNGHIYKHHVETAEDGTTVPRNNFYGVQYTSTITVPFNANPQSVKTFNAMSYEGTAARITNFETPSTNVYTNDYSTNNGLSSVALTDGEYYNIEDTIGGWYVESITTNLQTAGNPGGTPAIEFINREGKYFGYICGEATTLSNLDEKEFSVQGLGLANFVHDQPSLGESLTVTVANNTSNSYVGSDGSGGQWDLTSNANFTVDTNTFDIVGGVAESAQQIDLTITADPGFFIGAQDFSIGGASASTSGTGNSTVYIYTGGNVDAPVSKVEFTNNGQYGDPSNTVNAKVYLDAYTPTNGNTIYVDIDGDVKDQSKRRNACIRSFFNYYANQTVTYNSITNVTRTNQNDGTASGTVIDQHSTLLAEEGVANTLVDITFTADSGYFYSGVYFDSSVFTNLISTAGNSYTYDGYYTTNLTSLVLDSNNRVTSFRVKVLYIPPIEEPLFPDPVDSSGSSEFCDLNHIVRLPINLLQITVADEATDEIFSAEAEDEVAYTGGQVPVVVHGAPNTKYKIKVTKATSTTDATPVSAGFYTFTKGKFETKSASEVQELVATIPSKKQNVHYITLPNVTAKTRYDVVIDPVVDKKANTKTKVPLKLGDLQIIQNGVLATSLRMEPATVSGFNVTIPSGGTTFPTYTITLPEEITREKRKQPKVRYYERRGVVLGATSDSTRLVLESEIPGLHAGMLVIANGVPYETTVVEVVKNVIKLSAASTIADATEIKFIKNNASVKSFKYEIGPDSNVVFVTDKTRTVNQANASTNKIIFDQENFVDVDDQLKVGDQVYDSDGTLHGTITTLNPDSDNTKEIQISATVTITNNETLYIITPDKDVRSKIAGFTSPVVKVSSVASSTINVDSTDGLIVGMVPVKKNNPTLYAGGTFEGEPIQLGIITAINSATQFTLSAAPQETLVANDLIGFRQLKGENLSINEDIDIVYAVANKVGVNVEITGLLKIDKLAASDDANGGSRLQPRIDLDNIITKV